jgi:hypothetical protein
MQFLVSGTDTNSPNEAGQYCMDVIPGADSADLTCAVYAFSRVEMVVSQPLSIVFGQQATFTVGLLVYGHITSFTGTSAGYTADFTSVLAGFVVDDANGTAHQL